MGKIGADLLKKKKLNRCSANSGEENLVDSEHAHCNASVSADKIESSDIKHIVPKENANNGSTFNWYIILASVILGAIITARR